MTRPEKISRMVGSRNTNSGVRIKNSRVRKRKTGMTRKQVLLAGLILLLFMGSGISYVWSNFEMTQRGYDISELRTEEMRLLDKNRKLRLELAILESPQNLETLAHKLGLRQPTPDQIIVLK
ncbi:MAG: hypothetical protein DRH37_06790 [Deltaproteobacteria bacterium]|nr:MAG: hypothetical protein DRH37_06790 [Deltaproteobacteria bacterium]